MVTIVTDEPSREHVLEWMDVRGYSFPVLWDDGYFDQAGIEGTPETWVLDREGRLMFSFLGTLGTWDQDVGWMVGAVLEG